MNKKDREILEKDREILEKLAQVIFGCDLDDLSDFETEMLIAHARKVDEDYEHHAGLQFC